MNRIPTSLVSICFAGLTTLSALSQIPTQLAVPNSPAYEQAADQLRMSPPRQYDFSKAMMADVMRLMAEDAGISFFGLPEGASGSERLVTFSINASPFVALETLAKANGISLIFENGIWYIRPADDSELVGRIYQINYNAQELVTKNDQAVSSGGSSGGGSVGGGGAANGLNIQGSPDFFVTEPSRLLEDIRGILDLQTTGRNATFAPTGSVDTLGQLSLGGLQGQPDVFVRTGQNETTPTDSGNQAKVIWNSDANSLYVVATRQQHQWIEGYLAAADQPQPLVAIEVKFLEINKDPQSELGIDWTGTLGGGWGATLEGVDGSISSPINLDRVGDYALPTAILSYDDVNIRLRALFSDRRNRTVSYPRMLTLDNREVSFRSVINQPVLGSSASASLGAGATQTSSVEYVPIGTVINILPKRMNDGKVLLNVSITVSDIIGTEIINGNPFPIASSRVYTAPINVESGYTVAISGLDSAQDDKVDQGVPLLGKIPILGYAFKYRSDQRSRQHLMMLITPTLMDATAPGVSERPSIQNPWKNQPMTGAYPATASNFGPAQPAYDPASEEVDVKFAEHDYEVPDTPSSPLFEPTESEEVLVQSKERKGPFAKLFGKRKSKSIETGPVKGDRGVVAPQSPGVPAWEDSTPPMALAQNTTPLSSRDGGNVVAPPAPRVEPIPIPTPEPVKAQPVAVVAKAAPQAEAPAPKSGGGLRWDGTRLAGGTAAVPEAVNYLQKEYEAAEKGDGAKVAEVRAETARILEYVNTLRNDGVISVNGELSDEWWSLIKLKTQANALSRTNAPALVDTSKEP